MSEKKKTFIGGVHPNDRKELTKDVAISVMPKSDDYYISLSSHIGAPAEPCVKVGDMVACGQLIGKQNGFVSANIYSSVSGNVVGIEKRQTAVGGYANCIHIKAEGDEKVLLPKLDVLDAESILSRIGEAGIVGLGGAGFPASVKDKPKNKCDILVINAAECEPYLNCDNRLMLEYTSEVVQGIKLLGTALNIENIIVGIEDNKMEAYDALIKEGIKVELLKKRYPQGAEKMLIYACTKRKVPNKGALPSDVGVVVHNVATAYAVYDACINGEPLYKRVLTVSGKGVDSPKNLWVLNGTPHKDILEHCGINENTVKLISGGPMMGHALFDMNCSTTKAESGLLALTKEEIAEFDPTPCISCTSCAKACPMHLMPMYIDFYTQVGKTEDAVKYGAMDCMECGCCAYVCPAKRPLVQSIRLTKQRVREGKK